MLLISRHRRRLPVGEPPAPAPATPGLAVPAGVRAGLMTYRGALLCNLSIAVGGVILLFLAALGQSQGVAQAIALLSLIALLVSFARLASVIGLTDEDERVVILGVLVGVLVVVAVLLRIAITRGAIR